jgi:prepilin-type N-terminal cleavage/methylation domain-containing protein
MKFRLTAALRRSNHRGFTLLELLVVMIIIGILAALTLGAFRFAQESAARNRTISAHAAIMAALEQYKEKFGEYPDANNKEETDEFTGNTLKVGGAHMLYQAITADGSSAIAMQSPPPGGTSESDGKVSEEEMQSSFSTSPLPKSVIFPTNAPAGAIRARYLVDGWNRPFQYVKADPPPATAANPNPPPVSTVNPTYDLWSYGPLSKGGVPTDETLQAKRNPEVTGQWIKNW